MNDWISRRAAIDAVYRATGDGDKADFCVDVIRSVPSADVEPVVRCKDCKWFGDIGCAIKIIDDSDKPKEDDFCSFGERMDGEQDE